jgi:ABC-2 type transport system permease protein
MMRKIIQLALLHIKTVYQDRSSLIFGVLMPLIFTAVIGVGIQGFAPDEAQPDPTWQVDVVNLDSGELGPSLIARLEADPILQVSTVNAATAAANLAALDSAATLTLPTNLSADLLAGQELSLAFQLNAEDQIAAQIVEQAILAAINELSSSLEIAAISSRIADQLGLFSTNVVDRETYFADSFAASQTEWSHGAPISVAAQKETRREDTSIEIPNGFQQSSPGIAVMFALFFVVAGAGSILQEREDGTLRRLIVAPISRGAILAGKLLGVYITAIIQFSILVLFGQIVFGVDWGQSPAALALMILAFTFTITALGMLISALVRSYAQIDALSSLIIIPLSGLGGAMWPLEIVPAFMQKIALFVPTGWAMRGFHDIITRGLGLSAVLQEAGMLALFGVVFLAIGVWRFKYE